MINKKSFEQASREAIQNSIDFWDTQASKLITWYHPWTQTLQEPLKYHDIQWFTQAKLNVCDNCIDRHLNQRGNQTALIWEGNSRHQTKHITYQQLFEKVCQFANVLKSKNIKKGDRVCIYLPMIPEVVIAMLACARIGAIHSVIFAGFSPEALKTRLLDTQCTLLITADEGRRGTKTIPLKKNCDDALKDCPQVKDVIVVQHTHSDMPWNTQRDNWYHDLMQTADTHCEPVWMDANDPLFILYTSGSTGKPKGVVHSTGGYMVYVATTHKHVFDYQEGDIYWCTADVGWITGHSYLVYGPLANGTTTLLYEGVPDYPDYSRFWNIIDKHQVNIFYTAPTALRALRREGDEWVKKTSRKSLHLLGSVGEPINPDVWAWYHQVVGDGRCPIVNTWWQTETGGILISQLPGVTPQIPGSNGQPLFGIKADIVDDNGHSVPQGQSGKLVIKEPWPGMMQTIYGDHDRFVKTYLQEIPGCYLTGDTAYQDEHGQYWITGRNDDVIKVSGHRLGTEEIESAFLTHGSVAEAAVVGIPDDIKGENIYAFITLKSHIQPNDELKQALIQQIRAKIGAIATPKKIQWATALPKTRSGKIMRRILRKIATGEFETLGDLSTLADTAVIDNLIASRSES